MNFEELSFAALPDLIGVHALNAPHHLALVEGQREWTYRQLDAFMDRVAAALQREGQGPGHSVAICSAASLEYAGVFLGALRAGLCVAPLAPGVTATALRGMVRDAGARLLFVDAAAALALDCLPEHPCTSEERDGSNATRIALDGSASSMDLQAWLAQPGARPEAISIAPSSPFNIIYSSGTTGAPKGIVQAHAMRWAHIQRGAHYGYGAHAVTLLSTPLYSNTTLVVFVPTLAFGGTVVLMPKFDAASYLGLAQARRVTHTMLVPVQYRRLMAQADFEHYDLNAFRVKFATSAPFGAVLKADVLRRWPGQLIEFYGMTEGGGTCILEAHAHPDKLHTVGKPAPGHDIRLIDDDGLELGPGAIGEVVGHSASMMTGYHRQPAQTREAEWFDPQGKRFIRTGDVGRFDEQGFLCLLDRKKDLVISGGFNVYPSDLEAVLRAHPAVADVAVVGVASAQWGETPVAFVVLASHAGAPPNLGPGAVVVQASPPTAAELLNWANERLGKTQRLRDLQFMAELPRSAIGKVLKRELREGCLAWGR